MTKQELQTIIENHKKWLNHEPDGEKADLSYKHLSGVNLSYVDLRGADLRGSNFIWTDLSYADLNGADLRWANLSYANLSRADLRWANLSRADIRGANLCRTCLSWADLSDIRYNEETAFYSMVCPEKGSFIGYKKAGGKIVELMITENAKRSSATTRKCRCSEAVVLSISNIDGTSFDGEKVSSDYDKSFVYEVGKTISVDNFNENRWEECSAGIHFFLTRDEAVRYS